MSGMKRLSGWILVLLLLLLCGPASGEMLPQTEKADPVLVTTPDGAWPELNEAGYLDVGEFVYENDKDGVWRYCSDTLKVEIYRRTQKKPVKRVWYEAEVWSCDGGFDLVQAEKGKYVSAVAIQPVIASRNGCVLAINSDEVNYRWSAKDATVGLVVRKGEILWSKTKKAGYKAYPPLHNLVLYRDGDMEVYSTAEKTAQELVEMGAWHVLSFGPILIRDGIVNEEGTDLYKNNGAVARSAIGMVEKGHYFVLMHEGRTDDSRGCTVRWLADKLKELGCTLGFNLDGGRTSSIEFMGKQICEVGEAPVKKIYARKASELLYIGTSRLVEGYDPELASVEMDH